MNKKLWVGVISAILLTACSKQTPTNSSAASDAPTTISGSLLDRINKKGTITVGTEGIYAPFSYHDQKDVLTGYDVEVAKAVANKLGVKVQFMETEWDSMLSGLKSGRFDMVANQVALTTPERQATFDKSVNYSYSGPMILTRKGDDRIKVLADIKGLKAAQTLSSNYGEIAKANDAVIIPVDGMAQGLALVQQNRAEVTINDSLALLDYLKKTPNSGLQIAWRSGNKDKIGAGLVVNKGNTEALAKINKAIEELHQDGTLKKLGEEFFGEDVSTR